MSIGITIVTMPIEIARLIPNRKLDNPGLASSSLTELSIRCSALSYSKPLIKQIAAFESINNLLNSNSLYCEAVMCYNYKI